jgi:5-methylcytosine-specific restriction enzyme A
MARLRTLSSRVAMAPSRQPATHRAADRRMTGRALQARRLRLWAKDPHCVTCHRLVAMHEFELDHDVPLYQGGADVDDNCQVLCIECHARKTEADRGRHG